MGNRTDSWAAELEVRVRTMLTAQESHTQQAATEQAALDAWVADEIVAHAQAEHASAETAEALKVEHRAALGRVRETLGESMDQADTLRLDLARKASEAETLRRENAEALEAHRLALEAERAKPPQIVTTIVPPPPPAQIAFDTQRTPNGLLRSVVLRAEGYQEVTIDIERGPDNRMRQLKVR